MMAQILNIKKSYVDEETEIIQEQEDKEVEEEFNVHQHYVSPDVTLLEGDEMCCDSDGDNEVGYQNASYWALPENVRHAIDLSKKKSKHSDFCN